MATTPSSSTNLNTGNQNHSNMNPEGNMGEYYLTAMKDALSSMKNKCDVRIRILQHEQGTVAIEFLKVNGT